jgi:UDP-2,3-diacylglucosamine pyrophosphatase LpxH
MGRDRPAALPPGRVSRVVFMSEDGVPAARNPEYQAMYDCLVISDLHLGSDVCQARELETFLTWAVEHTRELVINGDIFDDLNFKRLTKRHFACLKIIRRNTDREDLRVVWVRGNHDGPAETISHIVGVEILDEYIYRSEHMRLLILHGDQFDKVIMNHPVITEIGCGLFYYIQKFAPHNAARWIRRISKKFQRNSEIVARDASAYARAKGFRYVTCGHTHYPLVQERDDVTYFNTGTWTEHPPCPFLSVQGTEIRLQFWPLPQVEEPAEVAAQMLELADQPAEPVS